MDTLFGVTELVKNKIGEAELGEVGGMDNKEVTESQVEDIRAVN